MKKSKMDVYSFLETKLLSSKVACMHKFQLKHWKYFTNADVASNARIVVFWNPTTFNVDLFASSAQGLHLFVSSLISQFSFMITFVYGFNTIIIRRSLWADLRRWCLVILIICSLQQISTMAKLFPLMKPQILENVVLILAFMISTIPDVTLVGLMVQFGVSLIVF